MNVHVCIKLGMVEIDDVAQQFKPDVNVFLYFKPVNSAMLESSISTQEKSVSENVRFINLDEHPSWTPNISFGNKVNETFVIDESYWIDTQTGLVFGRLNMIPHLQTRLDHQSFPFDRQLLNITLLSNNSLFQRWKKSHSDCPVGLRLKEENWQIECEIKTLADTWDLKDVDMEIKKEKNAQSSTAHITVYLQRDSKYYVINIGLVFFLIIMTQSCIFVFPYNETRFDFTITIALAGVALKFCTQSQVPKTNSLMSLDRYMVFGFLMLGMRFFVDACMLYFLDWPIGDGGYRGKCKIMDGRLNICFFDGWITSILSGIWLLASFTYLALGKHILRPQWESLSSRINTKRCDSEIIGQENPDMEPIEKSREQEDKENLKDEKGEEDKANNGYC